jgi:hypothetical protein
MGDVFIGGAGTGVVAVTSGIPTSICTGLTEVRNGLNVTLKWSDPADTIIDGQVLATWSHTVIVRKKGSYPLHESDGVVLFTNTIRDAYQTIGFEDTVPDTDDKYFYRAFPISVNGVVNLDPLNCFGVEMYSFIIDPNESNPNNAVSYIGANSEYTPAYMDFANGEFKYGSWGDAFFMDLFKPCMLKSDGTVDYYLDPNDYTKKIDGVTASDVADSTYDGNAMVEVGQIWISEKVYNGKHLIRIANGKVSNDFDCYTHTKKDGTLAQHIYRGLYDGGLVSNVVRSISGLAPCCNQTGQNQITYAKANGTGWNVDEYSLRRLINYLLILISKSLDTQGKFGKGVQDGGENAKVNSGTLNNKGMFFGYNTGSSAVKVFHIENWWGNLWKLTNGLVAKYGKLFYKMCEGQWDGSTADDYSEAGTGYIDSGVTLSGTSGSCIKTMKLVPGVGLVPKDISGSNSTYYCDGCWFNASVSPLFARFGGNSNNGLLCGAFCCNVYTYLSHSGWHCGVSLSYK